MESDSALAGALATVGLDGMEHSKGKSLFEVRGAMAWRASPAEILGVT